MKTGIKAPEGTGIVVATADIQNYAKRKQGQKITNQTGIYYFEIVYIVIPSIPVSVGILSYPGHHITRLR